MYKLRYALPIILAFLACAKINQRFLPSPGHPSPPVVVAVPNPPTPHIWFYYPQAANPGDIVHLFGSHFSATIFWDTERFSGVTAKAIGADTNSLSVIIPSGFDSGKLTVTVGQPLAVVAFSGSLRETSKFARCKSLPDGTIQ